MPLQCCIFCCKLFTLLSFKYNIFSMFWNYIFVRKDHVYFKNTLNQVMLSLESIRELRELLSRRCNCLLSKESVMLLLSFEEIWETFVSLKMFTFNLSCILSLCLYFFNVGWNGYFYALEKSIMFWKSLMLFLKYIKKSICSWGNLDFQQSPVFI